MDLTRPDVRGPVTRGWRPSLAATAVLAVLATTLGLTGLARSAHAADTLLSQGRPATASSTEGAGYTATNAVDGNTTGTRWASAQQVDPSWIQVDLGTTATITSVTLTWEAAYAKTFRLETSPDATTWTSLTPTPLTSTGATQTIATTGTGRYVRMTGTTRALSAYGYSLWELKVYGTTSATTTPTPTPTPTPTSSAPPTSDTPDFGPNVAIFDPATPAATIQSKLDTVFNAQKVNQFGDRRDALLFKPGTYTNEANIGYYTSIAGLGLNPDDVTINGHVTVDAFDGTGNATQNFWRSAENLAINPNGNDRWAVAQAAPFRRIDVHGNLDLFPASYGWASGGYIADTRVSGAVSSASQQQFYTRDSTIGSWNGSNWNMVFSGVQGAPAQTFPNPPYTVLPTTPVTREKPFLYVDGTGKYRVFVPALRTGSSGASWPNAAGSSIPMSRFYVAKPADSTATLQSALDNGLNLFFTPGVYHLSATLRVTRADTVVLGIGMATLVPDGGVDAMSVADVDGVKVAGILFDAGTTNSAALLTVGTAGSHTSHAANPTTVQDVFFRIGGAVAGKATTSLVVNSDNAIVDHIWAWRADHGVSATGWTVNTADTGLVVNGNNVDAYGLFVEHYQKYEVVWNGQNGKTIFFQNEMPYDPPSQATWRSGANGYAAYKVADTVTSHEAWGLGSYSVFLTDKTIHADRAFEVPTTSGVRFHDMATVNISGAGIDHVINAAGPATPTNVTPAFLVSYP